LSNIIINESDFKRIKSKIGYPLLDKVILEDSDLKELCIKPALEEYFRWFPKTDRYQTSVNGEFEVPFPDVYTFSTLDVRMTNSLANITGSLTGNRIADILVGNQYSKTTTYGGAYGTRYNFNGSDRAREMDITLRNMKISRRENQRAVVDLANRKVVGYAGAATKLSIIWAKFSYNFSEIRFERKEEAIELSQAFVLNHIADVFGMIKNNNLDIDVNVDTMRAQAEKLRENVIAKWTEFTKVIVMPKQMGVTSF